MKFICVALFAILACQAVAAHPNPGHQGIVGTLFDKLNKLDLGSLVQNTSDYFDEKFNTVKERISKGFDNSKSSLKSALEKSEGEVKENLKKLSEKLDNIEAKGVELVNGYKKNAIKIFRGAYALIKLYSGKVSEVAEIAVKNGKACAEDAKSYVKEFDDKFSSEINECKDVAGGEFEKFYNKLNEKSESVKPAVDKLLNGDADVLKDIDVQTVINDAKPLADEAESLLRECSSKVHEAAREAAQQFEKRILSC